MKQIIEKIKAQLVFISEHGYSPTSGNHGNADVSILADEAQQIVEALEGKGCATDELKKAFIAGSKFGAERFGSTAGWLGAKLENPDFDEWIATVKTQDEPKTETVDCDCTEPEGFTHGTVCPKCNRPFRITKTVNASLDRKRLNEKMLKDLSAKELEDDVNRNKI